MPTGPGALFINLAMETDAMMQWITEPSVTPAVVPALVGPLQALLVMLPAILVAVAGAIISMLKPRAIWAGIQLCWRLKVPLVAAALVVTAGVWAFNTIMPAGGAVAGEAAAGANWPLFRGNPQRTGAVAGTEGPNAGDVNWSYQGRGNEAFFASPAVVGNRVYISSANMNPLNLSGRIYALDADTGSVAWEAAPPGYDPTFSSPSVKGDYLVVGEGLHDTKDARVTCIDLSPGNEGEILWSYETSSHVECTPIIHNGRVYVTAFMDGIYCFELEPDANGEPQVVWHIEGSDEYTDPETSLAVYEDTVILGLGIGGHAIVFIDADTGEEKYRIDTDMPVFGPPAIHDGVAYIGMGTGDYVNTAEEARDQILTRMRREGASDEELAEARHTFRPRGAVWAIDLEDDYEVLWRHDLDRTVLGSVAIKDDELYFGSRDGYLYVLDMEGRRIGRWNAHSPVIASPAVTERYVYVKTVGGSLYAIDRRRLEPVWERRIGSRSIAGSISSPAVSDGQVFVGTENEGLVAVGYFSEEEIKPLWSGRLGGPGQGGNPEAWPLPSVGDFEAAFPADWMGAEPDRTLSTAPPAVLHGSVFVPVSDEQTPGLTVLSAMLDGDEFMREGHYETALPVHQSPAVVDGRALTVEGKQGDSGRKLHAVDIESLDAAWTRPVATDATGTFITDSNGIFIQDSAGKFAAVTPEGETLWRKPTGRIEHAPYLTGSMVIVATTDPKQLMVLDRKTGATLWQRDLDEAPTGSPVRRGDRLWQGTRGGMLALNLYDGRRHEGWPAEEYGDSRDAMQRSGVATETAVTTRWVTWINEDGELIVLSTEDGELIRTVVDASTDVAPLVSRQSVFYYTDAGVHRVLPHDDETESMLWLDTSWLGEPTAGGMAAGDGHLYLPSRGWGLVRAGSD